MRSDRGSQPHRHVALVAADHARSSSEAVAHQETRSSSEAVAHQKTPGFSLLRLSLAARFLIVAAASVLLWAAVFWALR
jgi:hypothetical protein